MRVGVVAQLMKILRSSGYPGYEEVGVNSEALVAQRLKERHTDIYGEASFTPAAICANINVQKKGTISIVQDKVATPSEPMEQITQWESAVSPDHIVAERSINGQANIHENYRNVFSQYGDFQISTGTIFTSQFHPWYLGMARPFTVAAAVGGMMCQVHRDGAGPKTRIFLGLAGRCPIGWKVWAASMAA